VLEHASRSRHIDPDRPPAAAGGLRSQVPDLVHGPRELLDCRQLQQAGRRERTRSFDRRSKAGIDLAASAITLGRQSLVRRCPADDQRRSGLVSFPVRKTSQGAQNRRRPHRTRALTIFWRISWTALTLLAVEVGKSPTAVRCSVASSAAHRIAVGDFRVRFVAEL